MATAMTRPLGLALAIGAAMAAALVLALTLGTLGAVFHRAGGTGGFVPADWQALRFTVAQAGISALLSLMLAVPAARALARRRFRGRKLLITLLGAPFILPVIVAVMGILAVFGRSGLLNDGLALAGFQRISIFGFSGVVLAHVFFNLPLAIRLILHGWQDIPAERFRLAESLAFHRTDITRHLERPMLRSRAPGILVTVFLICLTSFAVALTLGGGPRATTVELAIYQAFRHDFDLGRAASLASLQFAICALAAFLGARFTWQSGIGTGLDQPIIRRDAESFVARAFDGAVLVLTSLFLLAPLTAILFAGLPQLTSLPLPVWQAALRSLAVAIAAMSATIALALPLALASAFRSSGRAADIIASLPLASSSLIIGTGLFLTFQPFLRPSDIALPVTVAVNTAMALPFAYRALAPAAREVEADYGRLAESLGLGGAARLKHLTLPRLARPLGFAAGLTAALSMGDLGVVILFADDRSATLPLQIYRLMGAYRMEDAAGAAALLLAMSLGLFWLFDRKGREDA
jgi:thiamine transport system permease protein